MQNQDSKYKFTLFFEIHGERLWICEINGYICGIKLHVIMRRIILAICIIVSAFSLSAQDTLEQATQYYDNKEYDKAVPMFQRLSQGGDAYAQCFLGLCYDNGQGVVQDYTQAVYWYRKSAEQGDAWAQYNLGNCYK